jgi:hypothetical protein
MMPMPERSPKRPRDPNLLGRMIVQIATGEIADPDPYAGKDPAAVSLGRRGGLKGGPARAAKMTVVERRESARKAARARWVKQPSEATEAPKPRERSAKPMTLPPDLSPRRDSALPGD